MNEIINFVNDNIAGNLGYIIIFILGFFEFSKIKLNPITAILSWLGKRINREQNVKLEDVSNKLIKLSSEFEDHRIESWRAEILTFANQAMNGRNHTKEEFDHIVRVHDQYIEYIEINNLTNGQVKMAFSYIEKLYQKNRETNGFL